MWAFLVQDLSAVYGAMEGYREQGFDKSGGQEE